MPACKNSWNGKPKIKHLDKFSAKAHAHNLNKRNDTVHKSEAYRCPKCHFWHAGRIPPTLALKRELGRIERTEEVLVGKLIHALKVAINGDADHKHSH